MAASCAYTFDPSLPAHIRTVRVEVFANASGYPGLEAELVRALVREFQVDGTVVPGGEYADAVLRGEIVAVGRSVLQEDAGDDAATGRVTVTAVVTFEGTATGAKFLSRERVTSRDVRDSVGVFRLRRGEREADARGGAVTELARNIVRRAVEAW